eukprot:25337-Amphidinium_carterae.1
MVPSFLRTPWRDEFPPDPHGGPDPHGLKSAVVNSEKNKCDGSANGTKTTLWQGMENTVTKFGSFTTALRDFGHLRLWVCTGVCKPNCSKPRLQQTEVSLLLQLRQ